jgi:hypothetical protein
LVAGSIPAEPRTYDVLTEDFSVRDMLEMLLGPDGKRKLRLRRKTNSELFALYDSQLVLKHRSPDAVAEARRVLGHFKTYLGEYSPSPELAAGFLAQFKKRSCRNAPDDIHSWLLRQIRAVVRFQEDEAMTKCWAERSRIRHQEHVFFECSREQVSGWTSVSPVANDGLCADETRSSLHGI